MRKRKRTYVEGKRSVYRKMLNEALGGLGLNSPEWESRNWLLEREEAIAALRRVCGEVGDNDWDQDLHLADIIEKHLGKHVIE